MRQRQTLFILTLLVAILTVSLLWRPWRQVEPRPSGHNQATLALSAPAEPDLAAEDQSPRKPLENVGTSSTSQAVGEVEDEGALAVKRTRVAIESSVFGLFDLQTMMDMALNIAALDVLDDAMPEPSPDGSIRFPFLGEPDGVDAYLELRYSSRPEFAHVITLNMQCPKGDAPYVVGGAVRGRPALRMTVWMDEDGNLSDFTALTNLTPSNEGDALGFSMKSGEIREGALFHYSSQDPDGWSVEGHGYRDGLPVDIEIPANLGDTNLIHEQRRYASLASALLQRKRSLSR